MSSIPFIIAGPILRRLQPDQLVLWLVTREPLEGEFFLYHEQTLIEQVEIQSICQSVMVGQNAYISLINYRPQQELPINEWLSYDLVCLADGRYQNLEELVPHLLYPGQSRPHIVLKMELDEVLHGSCRKPHYESEDALLRVDEVLQQSMQDPMTRPALLMMSGDQIYADDVAGPMLMAIHQASEMLGLPGEAIEGAIVSDSEALLKSEFNYYQREKLLPQTVAGQALRDVFFSGVKKPIFTSDSAENHLITLSEVLAMYFLVWSPQLWSEINLDEEKVGASFRKQFSEELEHIQAFASGLERVQRALAHLPVYMIFDDHDVTDDWNLTRGWEESAYGHPFSRRILGNAMIGYTLCQGWGNAPERFPQTLLSHLFDSVQAGREETRNLFIDELLRFESWHYSLPTIPKLVVLDTRTRRWRSESSPGKPSGLMDWETLTELQQELIDEQSVLLISAAPIFGMKLIEAVQKIFTYFGHALTVDAENWMAHRGAANVILNIFLHLKTPQHFVVLSGDVHYSFAYDIKIRFRKNSPDIWQITCSGFKNEFPHTLLKWFDRLNRWFYGAYSPLNWLTKRRRMEIRSRRPGNHPVDSVVNQSAVGRLTLDKTGKPDKISILPAQGGEIFFTPREK